MSDHGEARLFAALQRVLATPEERRAGFIDELPDLLPDERERLKKMVELAEQGGEVSDGLVRALKPGQRVDDFELVKSLGAGGMGQVWEARQLSVDRTVALKLVVSGVIHGEDALTRLHREAHAAGNLSHPGLITIHAAGQVDGAPFVAMELIPGARTLHSWVRERDAAGPTTAHARQACELMVAIADAVNAAHEAGVVHRDLKPSNIMLRPGDAPVVVDFGLAGQAGAPAGAVTEQRIVSPAYQAPEQIENRATGKDRRTDVYQLGVTLYELVTLRRAFGDSSRLALERRIAAGDFPRPRAIAKGVPWELEAIILRAMEREPNHRYTSAAALRDDLTRFIEGSQLPEAARGGRLALALRRLPYLVRRHRVASAVLLALVLGGLAGAVAWSGKRPEDVAAFKIAGTQPVAWGEDDRVAPGDILGVGLRLDAPATIYAVSVFGERSPPSWVAPMEPLTPAMRIELDDLKAAGEEWLGEQQWALELGPGEHEVHITTVDVAHPDVPYEGIIVFVADWPSSVFERWMSALSGQVYTIAELRATGHEGLSYEAAYARLEDIGAPTRGAPLRLTPTERARLEELQAADVLGADELALDGVRVHRFMWRTQAELN